MEELVRIAAIDLTRGFEEQPGIRNQPSHRDARVVDAIFAADEVQRDERPIGPRQHVVVHRVDLAERGAHLSDLCQQPARQRRQCGVAFLERDALLAKRQEEVGTGIRIDDGLKRRFRLVHLERRLGIDGIVASGPEEITDDRNVRIKDLRAADR